MRAEVLLLLAALSLGGCAGEEARPSVEVTIPVLTTPAEPSAEPAQETPQATPQTTATASPTQSAPITKPRPTPQPTPQPQPTTAEARLARLVVTERPRPAQDYRRDAFGTSWKDTDGNGCNQRDDVLLRDAVRGSVRTGRQGRCDHDVLAGTWIDPYAGRVHHLTDTKEPAQAQAIQIDHVVPLAEAWVSGARAWSEDRREQFANDLRGLLAVDGRTNASKGASDPAAWRPRKGYQCAYATRWIATKHRWALTVDASEVRALREMLGYC